MKYYALAAAMIMILLLGVSCTSGTRPAATVPPANTSVLTASATHSPVPIPTTSRATLPATVPASTSVATPTQPPASSISIVGIGGPTHHEDLYVLSLGDATPRRLTQFDSATFRYDRPNWSPDGSQVLFAGGELFPSEIYLADADAGKLVQLTHTPAYEGSPTWSPSGDSFAYTSLVPGESLKILLMSRDGQRTWRLTRDDEYDEEYPEWSPAGNQLAFVASKIPDTDPKPHLRIVNADGSDERGLAVTAPDPNTRGICCPQWSPDGAWIAYTVWSKEPAEDWIALISSNGAQRHDVKPVEGWYQYPEWSPDGQQLAFAGQLSASAVDYDLFVMDIETLTVRKVAEHADLEARCWLPDGHRIAFFGLGQIGIHQRWATWIVDDNGSGRELVTEDLKVEDCFPKQDLQRQGAP